MAEFSKLDGLQGSPEKIALADILISLQRSESTGILKVESGPVVKDLFIKNGDIIFAVSNEKEDRLTDFLLKQGKITPMECHRAEVLFIKSGWKFGKVFVELGILKPSEVYLAVRQQIEEIVLSLFVIEDGSLKFIEGPLPREELITLQFSTANIIYRGIKRIENAIYIKQAAPAPEAVLGFSQEALNIAQDVVIDEPDQIILSCIDGARTLNDILPLLPLSEFEALRSICALLNIGMITAKEAPKAPPEVKEVEEITAGPAEEISEFVNADIVEVTAGIREAVSESVPPQEETIEAVSKAEEEPEKYGDEKPPLDRGQAALDEIIKKAANNAERRVKKPRSYAPAAVLAAAVLIIAIAITFNYFRKSTATTAPSTLELSNQLQALQIPDAGNKLSAEKNAAEMQNQLQEQKDPDVSNKLFVGKDTFEAKKQQEEAARLKQEREALEAKRQQEEAARLKQEREAAEVKKQQEEAARLKQEREALEAKRQQEEVARLKQEREALEAKRQQEEAARLKRERDAATVQNKPAPEPPGGGGEMRFGDQFNNNAAKWEVFDTSMASARIADGHYYIKNKREAGAYVTLHWGEAPAARKLITETAIKTVSAFSDNHAYGFVVGARDAGNNYTFQIRGDGAYSIRKYQKGAPKEVAGGKIKGGVFQKDSFNALKFEKDGGKLRFYINDNFIDEVSDVSFAGGKIGFSVEGKSEIAVDYTRTQIWMR